MATETIVVSMATKNVPKKREVNTTVNLNAVGYDASELMISKLFWTLDDTDYAFWTSIQQCKCVWIGFEEIFVTVPRAEAKPGSASDDQTLTLPFYLSCMQ